MATRQDIADFYIAVLGRAPDPQGLEYWFEQVTSGALSLEQMCANWMESQPEVVAWYAGATEANDFVRLVYQQVLARQPDAGGLSYWMAQLDSGAVTRDGFIAQIVNSVRAQSDGVDKAVLDHRSSVGLMAAEAGVVQGEFAQALIQATTADPATVLLTASLIQVVASSPQTVASAVAVLVEVADIAAAGRPELLAHLAEVFSGLSEALMTQPDRAVAALAASVKVVQASALEPAFVDRPALVVADLLSDPQEVVNEAEEILNPSTPALPVFSYQLISQGEGLQLRLEGTGREAVTVDLTQNEVWLAGRGMVYSGGGDLVDVNANSYGGPVTVTGSAGEIFGPQALLAGVDVRHVRDVAEAVASLAPAALATLTDIQVTDAASVAQLAFIVAGGNRGLTVISALSDTAAQLVAMDAALLSHVSGVVTVLGHATVAEATVLVAWDRPVTFSLQDSAAALAAADVALLGAATEIIATDTATVAQAAAIALATNAGTLSLAALADTVEHLLQADPAILALVTGTVTATNAATASQAEALLELGAVVFNLEDTATALAQADAGVLSAAVDIAATGASTVAEADALAAATNSGTTTIEALTDTVDHLLAVSPAALALVTGPVTATNAATVEEAEALLALGEVVFNLEDTALALAQADVEVLNAAVHIAATGAATVAEATALAAATNSGTTLVESLADTVEQLLEVSPAALALVTGTVTATTAATVEQAEALLALGAVVFNLEDTASALAQADVAVLNAAVHIAATGAATVAEATALAAAANSGTTSVEALTDTVEHLLEISPAALALVTGTVTATNAATVEQAEALLALGAVVFNLEDAASALAQADVAVLNAAVHIAATGAATVAEATALAAATNSGTTSVEALTDTVEHLLAVSPEALALVTGTVTATDAATAAQAEALLELGAVVFNLEDTATALAQADGTVLNASVNIVATGSATVAEATVLAAATNSGTTSVEALTDTVEHLMAVTPTGLALVTGVVTATNAATASQAEALLALGAVVFSLEDTATALAQADTAVLNAAVDIVATGPATVAQALVIAAATNSGTTSIEALTDTVEHLLEVGPATLEVVTGAVTAMNAATAVQAEALLELGAVVFNLEDTATELAQAAGAVLNAAVDVAVTGAATVAEATVIASASNSGTTSIEALTDTVEHLLEVGPATLALVTGAVTATNAATVVQADALLELGAVVFNLEDTASSLAQADLEVLNAAVHIAATGAATVAEATTLAAATNSGTTSIESLTDTVEHLLEISPAALALVTGTVTATNAATAEQAESLLEVGAVVFNLEDSASALAQADLDVLNAAVHIAATGAATVAEATVLAAAANSGTTSVEALTDTVEHLLTVSPDTLALVTGTVTATNTATAAQAEALLELGAVVFNLEDTATALVQAEVSVLNAAVHIAATGAATVAEATALAAVTNSGTTSVESLTDTVEHLLEISPAALALITGAVMATDAATVEQAEVLLELGAVVFNLEDTAAALARADAAVLNAAVHIAATGAATAAEATALAAAMNSGTTSVEALTDTTEHLLAASSAALALVTGPVTATTAATVDQAGALLELGAVVFNLEDTAAALTEADIEVLNAAVHIAATGAATVAEATVLAAATNSGTTSVESLTDTVEHLLEASPAVLALVTGAVTATTAATAAQAEALLELGAVVFNLEDSVSALAQADIEVLNAAVHIAATGAATVAEVTALAAATNSGTTSVEELTDTVEHLMAVSPAALALVTGPVTATNAATAAQAEALLELGAVVFNLEDSASALAQADLEVLNAAVHIAATGAATVAEATSLTAATNSGTTSVEALIDTTEHLLAASSAALALVTGTVTATTAATVEQAEALLELGAVVFNLEDSASALAQADIGVLNAAVHIAATGAATVAEATALAAATNSGTTSVEALTDTVENLLELDPVTLALVTGSVTVTNAATVVQAEELLALGAVVFSLEDTVPALTQADTEMLNASVDIVATGPATVAEVEVLAAATNSGTTTIEALTDTVEHLLTVSPAALVLVTGVVTATNAATAADAEALLELGAVVFNLEDSASALAQADVAVLSAAVHIAATGAATVGEATALAAATNSGTTSVEALTDTVAHLLEVSPAALTLVTGVVTATNAATVEQAEALLELGAVVFNLEDTASALAQADLEVLNAAVHIAATGAATVTEVTALAAATNSGTTSVEALTDTVEHLLEISPAALALVTGTVTATTAATIEQAEALLELGAVVFNLEDTAAALAQVDVAVLNAAVHIVATGAATVAEGTVLAAATNSGTTSVESLTDTVEHLLEVSPAALALVTGAVTATNAATVEQAEALLELGAVVFNLEDTASGLAQADIEVLNATVDIVATGAATVVEAEVIAAASNTGTTTIEALTDTVEHLLAVSPASLALVTGPVTATNAATVEQAEALLALGEVVFNLEDTASALAQADVAVLNAAVHVAATGAATVAEATVLAAATNSGTTSVEALTDTVEHLLAVSPETLALVTGTVTATDAATAAQAEALLELGAVVFNLEDTATALAQADGTVLNASVNIVATGPATVAEATALAAAANSGTTSAEALTDTVEHLLGVSPEVLALVTGTVTATNAATVEQAEVLLALGAFVFSLEDTATALVQADTAVLNAAVDIVATGSATVAEAEVIAAATNSGTTSIEALTDTVEHLLEVGPETLELVTGALTATNAATVEQAEVLLALGEVVFNLEDTASALAQADIEVLNAAVDIAATGSATVAEAMALAAATNSGTTSVEALTDTVEHLLAVSPAALALITGMVTATSAATAEQAEALLELGAVVFNLEDTASALAQADLQVLNAAVHIAATGAATVAEATVLAVATNSGTTSVESVTDTVEHLLEINPAALALVTGTVTATNAATVEHAEALLALGAVVFNLEDTAAALAQADLAVLNAAVHIAATGAATVAEATALAAATNSGTTSVESLTDTVEHLLGVSPEVLALVTGPVTVTNAATVEQAEALLALGAVVFNLEDTASALAQADLEVLNAADHIAATGAATAAEAEAIAAATNSGTTSIEALTDTVEHLLMVSPAALALVTGPVTATNAATAAQAEALLELGAVVFSLEDSASVLAQADLDVLNAAVHIAAMGAATVAEATVIGSASNSGTTSIEALTDTVEHLLEAGPATLALVTGVVTATDPATAAQAEALLALGTVVFNLEDTASALAQADIEVLSAAVHIAATGVATVAQATALAAATNSGTTSVEALTDTVEHLLEISPAALALVTGTVTATNAATVEQAEALLELGAVVFNLEDTTTALAQADILVLDAAVDIVATGAATVAEATFIASASNSGTTSIETLTDTVEHLLAVSPAALALITGTVTATSAATAEQAEALLALGVVAFNLEDTASVLAQADVEVLNAAVDIAATGAATAAEAEAIAAATNSGTTSIEALTDTVAHLLTVSPAALALVTGVVTATNAATAAQAESLLELGAVIFNVEDTAAALAQADAAVLNAAVGIVATGAATVAEATAIATASSSVTTSIEALTDTADNLLSIDSAVLALVTGNVTVSQPVTVAQASALLGLGIPLTFSILDTAANVAGGDDETLAAAAEIALITPATVAQAQAIVASGLEVDYSLQDEVLRFFSMSGEDVLTVVQPGTLVSVTDAATVHQLSRLDSANGEDAGVDYVALRDSSSELWSGVTVSPWVVEGVDVILTTTISVAGLTALDAANGAATVEYRALADDVDGLFLSGGEDVVPEVVAGLSVSVLGEVRLDQLAALDVVVGDEGQLLFTTVRDYVFSLLSDSPYLQRAVTVSLLNDDAGWVTLSQREALDNLVSHAGWSYHLTDTISQLAAAGEDVLAGATDIRASGTATVSQASDLAAAENVGTTSILALADTAAAVAAAPPGVLGLVTVGGIKLTTAATVSQASAILGFDLGIEYALEDSLAALMPAGAVSAVIQVGVSVTVTDRVTLAQLEALDEANGDAAVLPSLISDSAAQLLADTRYLAQAEGVFLMGDAAGVLTVDELATLKTLVTGSSWTFSLSDGVSALALAPLEALNQAQSVFAAGVADASQASSLAQKVSDPAVLTLASLADSAAELLTLDDDIFGLVAGAITATGTVTAEQATQLAAFETPIVYTLRVDVTNFLALSGTPALIEATSVEVIAGESAVELTVAQWQLLGVMGYLDGIDYQIVDQWEVLFKEQAGLYSLTSIASYALAGQSTWIVMPDPANPWASAMIDIPPGISVEFRGTTTADTLRGTDGAETLRGLDGDDVLIGGDGDDVLIGGEGNDWLEGGAGDDQLYGGAGDDVFAFDSLESFDQDSVIDGGYGVDTILFTAFVESPDWNSLFEPWGWQRANPLTLVGVEQIGFAMGANVDFGDSQAALGINRFQLGAADTWICYSAEEGTPLTVDAAGLGGHHLAMVSFWEKPATVTILNLNGSLDTASGFRDSYYLAGDLKVFVAAGVDANILTSASHDVIWGADGDDAISTGTGSDWVLGDLGADQIRFGEDNDADIYAIRSSADGGAVNAATGYDTIFQFNVQDDKIQLSAELAAQLGSVFSSAGDTGSVVALTSGTLNMVDSFSMDLDPGVNAPTSGFTFGPHRDVDVFVLDDVRISPLLEDMRDAGEVAALLGAVQVNQGDEFLLVVNAANDAGFGIYHFLATESYAGDANAAVFDISIIGLQLNSTSGAFTVANVDTSLF